jgi:hypothetical protein
VVTPIIESTDTNRVHKGVEDFASELEALGGNFISCSPNEVADKILEILHIRGMDQLLVWEAPYLPAGLLEQLSDAGIHLSHPTGETHETSRLINGGICWNCGYRIAAAIRWSRTTADCFFVA